MNFSSNDVALAYESTELVLRENTSLTFNNIF